MRREKNQYEGNSKIAEDQASYSDYRTNEFIDLVADLAVTLTLAKLLPDPPAPDLPWLREAKRRQRNKPSAVKNKTPQRKK